MLSSFGEVSRYGAPAVDCVITQVAFDELNRAVKTCVGDATDLLDPEDVGLPRSRGQVDHAVLR
jgi:hypothetical protein